MCLRPNHTSALEAALTLGPQTEVASTTLVTLETRLHADRFEEIFRLACDAGKVLHQEMRRAVKNRTNVLVGALSTTGSTDAAQREADDADMRDD